MREIWKDIRKYERLYQISNFGRVKRLEKIIIRNDGQDPLIIHLGDHDPSGIDMTKDIENRMFRFKSKGQVERIALNYNQVEQYDPPPNPAKLTDTRCNSYILEHGSESWELDALEPSIIKDLIEETILKYLDKDCWKESCKKEKQYRNLLKKMAKNLEKE